MWKTDKHDHFKHFTNIFDVVAEFLAKNKTFHFWLFLAFFCHFFAVCQFSTSIFFVIFGYRAQKFFHARKQRYVSYQICFFQNPQKIGKVMFICRMAAKNAVFASFQMGHNILFSICLRQTTSRTLFIRDAIIFLNEAYAC